MEALVQEKLNDIMRAKYRKNMKQYRESHREYYNIKSNDYYQLNKERLAEQRKLKYKKTALAEKQQKVQDGEL